MGRGVLELEYMGAGERLRSGALHRLCGYVLGEREGGWGVD